MNRLSVWGKGEKFARRGKGKGEPSHPQTSWKSLFTGYANEHLWVSLTTQALTGQLAILIRVPSCAILGHKSLKCQKWKNITKTASLPFLGTSHSTNKEVFECLRLNLGYIFKKKSGNKRKQERIRKTVPDCAPLYRGMRKGDLRLLTAEDGITLLF